MLPIFHVITPKFPLKKPQQEDGTMEQAPIKPHRRKKHAGIEVQVHEDGHNKKHVLQKEVQRLNQENKELQQNYVELEEICTKKLGKFKDKIEVLQKHNVELLKEREFFQNRTCFDCKDLAKSLEQSSVDNNALRTSLKEAQVDMDMLKNVIFRLNCQLERYQNKMRKKSGKVEIGPRIEDHSDHPHTPISWGSVNSHTLAPLLNAYQDFLDEKDDLIKNYESKIEDFTEKLHEIVEENALLHKKLTEDSNCSIKLKEQLQEAHRDCNVVKEQNDLLIKKCSLKQDKVQEILRVYESKVEQLKRDYNCLHEEFCKNRNETLVLKEKNKALSQVQDEFKSERQNYIPTSVHKASVEECKKLYEELKRQYEQEKEKLKESLLKESKKNESLMNKITQLERSSKKLELKYFELEKTFKEVFSSKLALKKQLHKVMGFAKDMVLEQETLLKALHQRQAENKVVTKIGSEMAVKMDSLKSKLKNVQRNAWQDFETVEQKIQEQNELIECLKSEHSEEVERLQQLIKRKELSGNVLLKNETVPMPTYLLFQDKYQ